MSFHAIVWKANLTFVCLSLSFLPFPFLLSSPLRAVQANIPNLSKVDDIADYVMGNVGAGGAVSDSEGEDEASQVILPQVRRSEEQSDESIVPTME
jgi:hypothetical protein